MKRLLTEVFNLKNGTYKKKDGEVVPIVYIDPETSENTYQYKDEIKKYRALWFKPLKTWAWYPNNDPNFYRKYIQPCLEFLTSVEQNPNNEVRNVIAIIDKLISEIDNGNVGDSDDGDGETTVEYGSDSFDVSAVKNKLEAFKRELTSIMSDEEFKAKMLPIIKFRNAQGHQYSLTNAILILIQDPKATLVKSKGNWGKMNRLVKLNAPRIALWVPYGGTPLSKYQKAAITQRFLDSRGKSSTKELTPGDKEELAVQLKPRPQGYKLQPCFYDVRFTEQMEGKEDIVGNGNADDIQWYDDSGDETQETAKYCDAIISIIQDRGIKVGYVDDMGGARGVSKSGAIDVLKDTPKNVGLFNTLVHEYAHELLHQSYIKNSNDDPNGYGQYFIGKAEGRAAVERQAELTAWIVLRNFGFDMPTNINYVGLWGMDEKNCTKVFDQVANVSTAIIKDIYSKLDYKK